MKLRFLSAARAELVQAAEFYDDRVTGLGADFLVEVDAALARVIKFPQAWKQISRQFRGCPLRRFPFTLIYTILEGDEILILSVFHQSRQPGSWRKNL
jgi:toxin ParE2